MNTNTERAVRPRRSVIFSPGLTPEMFPKALGFSGKGSIHPKQIAALNSVFAPDEAAVAHAERVSALA